MSSPPRPTVLAPHSDEEGELDESCDDHNDARFDLISKMNLHHVYFRKKVVSRDSKKKKKKKAKDKKKKKKKKEKKRKKK